MTYEFSETVPLQGEFTDDAGALIDPSEVSLELIAPSGAVTTYPYPGSIARVAAGSFSFEFVPDESRAWRWTWIGTLNGRTLINKGSFWVKHP
jgi:hypothetical protein